MKNKSAESKHTVYTTPYGVTAYNWDLLKLSKDGQNLSGQGVDFSFQPVDPLEKAMEKVVSAEKFSKVIPEFSTEEIIKGWDYFNSRYIPTPTGSPADRFAYSTPVMCMLAKAFNCKPAEAYPYILNYYNAIEQKEVLDGKLSGFGFWNIHHYPRLLDISIEVSSPGNWHATSDWEPVLLDCMKELLKLPELFVRQDDVNKAYPVISVAEGYARKVKYFHRNVRLSGEDGYHFEYK